MRVIILMKLFFMLAVVLDVCVCAESFEWLIEWDMGRGDMMEN
jgi:hypothetical protein